MSNIYTILEFYDFPGIGIDIAIPHGSYRYLDDAYSVFETLVKKEWSNEWPEDYHPKYNRVSHPNPVEIDIQEGQYNESGHLAKLRSRLRQITDDQQLTHDRLKRLSDLAAMRQPYEPLDAKLMVELEGLEAEHESLEKQKNKIMDEIELLQNSKKTNTHSTGYGYLFSDPDTEATATINEGEKQVHFFIIKTPLL